MELIINEITDLKPIDFNYEEIKKDIIEKLEKYNNLVYTDESIKEAKEDRAKLNKLAKAFNDRKIEIKKEFMKPYDEFEGKMKELIELVQKPVLAIDGQVKAYETRQKEEKREQINQVYKECTNALSDDVKLVLSVMKIFDEKWLNASVSISSITKEITEAITKISNDIAVIESFKSEFEVQLKDKYTQTTDLGSVMVEKARLEQLKAQMEERKRLEEERERQIEQPQPIQEVVQAKVEEPMQTIEDVKPETETMFAITFRVQGTREQLTLLKEFLTRNKIQYGKVE